METTPQNLPPGLMDKCLEIVWDFDSQLLKALYGGQFICFKELPKHILKSLYHHMVKDTEAMIVLIDRGPEDDFERMWLYYKCKCGGFSLEPDMDAEGNVNGECWPCGCGGQCILRPLFKDRLKAQEGYLTSREIEVIKELTTPPFPPVKAVAVKLDVSESTLKNHKQHIFHKTGVDSIQELTSWAYKNGLI